MVSDKQAAEKIKVLVVDDHTLFAEGTVSLLSSEPNLEIAGIATDGKQGLSLIKIKTPDIILLDISLPDCSGIQLIDDIKLIHPQAKIIMLTGLNPQQYLKTSLQKGVNGFLLKECNKEEMIEAIAYVAQGKDCFSKGLMPFLRSELVDNEDTQQSSRSEATKLLSKREKEIMELLVKGLDGQEISLSLGITIRTVNFHIGNILGKLGVKSRLKAIIAWTRMLN